MRIPTAILLICLCPAAVGQEGLLLRTQAETRGVSAGGGSHSLKAGTWIWGTESRQDRFRVFDAGSGEYVVISQQAVRELEITAEQQSLLQTAKADRQLARQKMEAGDYTAALVLWQKNLQTRQQVLPAAHPYLANDLTDVAACLDALGRTADSLPLLQQATEIRTHLLGDQHPATVRALRNLALARFHAGDTAAALSLSQRALHACEAMFGDQHAETATACSDLAIFQQQSGDDRLAVRLLEKSLQILSRIDAAHTSQAATDMHHLAISYDNLDEHDKAEHFYRQAVAVRKERLGPEHLATAEAIFMLGWLYDELDDFSQAEQQYQQALRIFQTNAQASTAQQIQAGNQLGKLYARHDNPAKARPLLLQVLAMQKETLGDQHVETIDTLAELALVMHELNETERARDLFETSLQRRSEVLGPEHPDTIQSLLNLAWFHDERQDNRQAFALYQRVRQQREQQFGAQDPDTLDVVRRLGLVCVELEDNERAETLLREVLDTRQAVHGDEHADTADAYADLGWFYHTVGELEKATPLIQQSLEINESLFGPDDENTAHACTDIARLYARSEDFQRALAFHERALDIFTKSLGAEHRQTAIAMHDVALLQLDLGEYQQARQLATRALRVFEQRERDAEETVRVLDTLGWACDRSGDYAAAREFFQRALQMSVRLNGDEHELTASCLFSLGSACGSLGEYERAESLMDRALVIRRRLLGDDSEAVGDSLLNLGWLKFQQQQYADAEPLFEQAAKIYTAAHGPVHSVTSIARINLAEIFQQKGDFAKAEALLQSELTLCRKTLGDTHPRCGDILRVLGRVSLDQKDGRTARERLQQALRIDRRVLDQNHPTVAMDLELLSVAAAVADDMTQAVRLREQSRQCVRRHMAELLPGLSQQSQQKYLASSFRPQFTATLSLALAQRDDPRTAMLSAGWLLNGKSVAQEVLAESALLSSAETAPLVRQLRTVRDDIARLAVHHSGSPQPQQREQLAALETRQQLLQRQIAARGLGLSGTDPWIAAGTLQSALPFDSVFVNIARFEVGDVTSASPARQPARYVAWLMPAAGAGDVRVIDLGEAAPIDGLVSGLRQQVMAAPSAMVESGEAGAVADFQTTVAQLSRRVLQPLLAELPSAQELIISPDGELWKLPWNALLLADGRYLVEQYRTRFVLSGRELVRRLPERSAISAPVLFADPNFDLQAEGAAATDANTLRAATSGRFPRLAASAAEAASIKPSVEGYTGTAASVFLQNAAQEAAFKNLHRPQVLLLSTHGFFQDAAAGTSLDGRAAVFGNPLLRCGLALAGCNAEVSGSSDDGILTGLEIVGTDLRGTELVVLSACETGLGDIRNGEGVAGLRQAFQLAGAQSVVSSLWQVEDGETARLMALFFQNLNEGMDKSAALRNAQLTRIAARRTRHGAAHPFFWAAFTLTGRN